MSPVLLHSQLETLEPPEAAVTVDVTPSPEAIAATIRLQLGLRSPQPEKALETVKTMTRGSHP
jgi:hypothetical protein